MDSKHSAKAKFRQYLATVIANLASFSIGTMLGWTSPMQPLLQSPEPPIGTVPMTREQISWLGSINFVGAIVGTFFWGRLADRIGRKLTGCVVAIPFTVSWIIILMAPDTRWLYLARFIVGVGCSGTIINTPMFVAEIAEDAIRGALGSYLMLFINAGCLFSYVIGSFVSLHTLTAICLGVPLVYISAFCFLPDSPVHLYTHDQKSKAETALLWYRADNVPQVEIELSRLRSRAVSKKCATLRSLAATRGTVKAMVIGLGFIVGQQFCGILAILTYTVMIFQSSGSSLSPHSSAIVVGSLQLCSAWMSSLLVDRVGRKVLLISSYIFMALSLLSLGSYFHFQKYHDMTSLMWVPIASLSVHVISYSIGAGPVPFVVMAETFSPDVRGMATSVIQFFGTSLSFATVKLYPTFIDLMGTDGCFWFYGVWCILLATFTLLVIPETKGRTLQYILRQLNGEDTSEEDEVRQEIFTSDTKTVIVTEQSPLTSNGVIKDK